MIAQLLPESVQSITPLFDLLDVLERKSSAAFKASMLEQAKAGVSTVTLRWPVACLDLDADAAEVIHALSLSMDGDELSVHGFPSDPLRASAFVSTDELRLLRAMNPTRSVRGVLQKLEVLEHRFNSQLDAALNDLLASMSQVGKVRLALVEPSMCILQSGFSSSFARIVAVVRKAGTCVLETESGLEVSWTSLDTYGRFWVLHNLIEREEF